MYKHHEVSIRNVTAYFQEQSEVIGLLLGGSIAHGFEAPTSDIDVMIFVSDQSYEERMNKGRMTFFNTELCTYPEGYVDGKYLGMSYLNQVAERGSEPARFAFQNAQVLLSRGAPFDKYLESITHYPIDGKAGRMQRFYAQFEAWNWYANEALRLENRYLLWVAISKLVLFGGRLILTHNELLYPYHKWFHRVLEGAKDMPSALLKTMEELYEDPSPEDIRHYYEMVKGFQDWGATSGGWPAQFMRDSELNWQTDAAPVDDL